MRFLSMRNFLIRALIFMIAVAWLSVHTVEETAAAGFPRTHPDRACYPRPLPDETLDITPPGFCWWRAGERGEILYRLKIMDFAGKTVYESPLLEDPAHAPDKVLAQGSYTWTVEALDRNGRLIDTRPPQKFTIAENAFEQPWIPPEEILARVTKEHPRLLFAGKRLAETRDTLATTRKEAFRSLKGRADRALRLSVPPEPDYDKIRDRALRRTAYFESFGRMRGYHDNGMLPLALMYLLTGEKEYGEKAKELLLGAAEWDPEGISSVMAPYGDEVGLGLARSGAQTYDWIYDLLSPAEREKVSGMLAARADQMLRRLLKRDYIAYPAESHNGRLPGYLVEHAIVMAEHPRAQVWMDYAMRTFMTSFPHWAGKDGGWAEGVPYALSYNTIYLVPFESLRHATGFDLWRRPFYRKVRYFFLYNTSPRGDICPFGDTEHSPARGRASSLRSFMLFHANLYDDPTVRWWADQMRTTDGSIAPASGLAGLILPDVVKPQRPVSLANDAAFFGVGWAALHSDVLDPDEDLMVMFKSSPYGGVSHSHADQNSFAIMKGGRALAIPAGARYPTHGSPFHRRYVQLTMAHNAILVDGRGQINRDSNRGGELTDFRTTPHMGYVCGDARNCFGNRLQRNRRHVLMIRPSIVLVVDDLAAAKPAEFQWLLHAHNQFELDERAQTIISRKDTEAMTVLLITHDGFSLSQTNEWPIDPKEGFPKLTTPAPAKQWHLTATPREKSAERRIAAVMVIHENGRLPDCRINRAKDGVVEVTVRFKDGAASARIDLNTANVGEDPIIEAKYTPVDGREETIAVK